MKKQHSAQRGIAGLLLIVAVALFLLSAGALIAIQGNASILSGQFDSLANRAHFLADSGIEDGIQAVARDNTYNGNYTIVETDGTVAVNISGSFPVIIIATSTVTRNQTTVQRTIQANVMLSSDGAITSITKINL